MGHGASVSLASVVVSVLYLVGLVAVGYMAGVVAVTLGLSPILSFMLAVVLGCGYYATLDWFIRAAVRVRKQG